MRTYTQEEKDRDQPELDRIWREHHRAQMAEIVPDEDEDEADDWDDTPTDFFWERTGADLENALGTP